MDCSSTGSLRAEPDSIISQRSCRAAVRIPSTQSRQEYVRHVLLFRSRSVPYCSSVDSLVSLKEPTVDCNQFKNDHDIIRQFPFPVRFVPVHYIASESTVTMDENQTFIREIYLDGEQIVPPSVFCLSKLRRLYVVGTPFVDGSSFVLSDG